MFDSAVLLSRPILKLVLPKPECETGTYPTGVSSSGSPLLALLGHYWGRLPHGPIYPIYPREEKTRARDASAKLKKDAEDARMQALYKEHVLGVKPVEGGIVPISAIAPAAPKAKQEEVGSFGD